MMKKMLFACCVLIQILVFSACKEKENSSYQVSSVSIRLIYPEGSGFEPVEGSQRDFEEYVGQYHLQSVDQCGRSGCF